MKPSKEVSRLRLDHVLTMGGKGRKRERERERERERLQGMFYRDPTVGTKCTYQNLQLAHIKVDVAKMGSWISHVRLRVAFVRRTR